MGYRIFMPPISGKSSTPFNKTALPLPLILQANDAVFSKLASYPTIAPISGMALIVKQIA
jgi:hypothetical protein